MSANTLAVVVAEANPRIRHLLRRLFDHDERFRVVGEMTSGDEVAAYGGAVDLLVVDLTVPGLNSHDAVQRFRIAQPHATIVVLAAVDTPYLRDAMRAAGADGYLVAVAPNHELIDRVAAFTLPRVL